MRIKQYTSNAERQKAYRQRRQRQQQGDQAQVTHQEGTSVEPIEKTNLGTVQIGGVEYVVTPSPEAYEISKRVYRMLCDYPSKRKRFDELLRACGREIKDKLKHESVEPVCPVESKP
jgi:hypothetical protein